MTHQNWVEFKVWGEFACFTRPEMKVERVSYEAPTPSAARGICEAIFWKPEFQWYIHEIRVLKHIQKQSLLRSEVKSKIPGNVMKSWDPEKRYNVDADRTQRHSLVLRDVAYVIRAEPVPNSGRNSDRVKYREQFLRRVSRGQCLWRPYLGCREFSAHFALPDENDKAIGISMGLGRMLFDFVYEDTGKKNPGYGKREWSASPLFFPAQLEEGTLRIPQELYQRTRPEHFAR